MKCHYITDRVAGRILIPGCMGVAVYQSLHYCTCPRYKKDRVSVLEDRIKKLEDIIKAMKIKIDNVNK